jgi:hypothetical protein
MRNSRSVLEDIIAGEMIIYECTFTRCVLVVAYHDVQGLVDGDVGTRAQVSLHAIEIHKGTADLREDLYGGQASVLWSFCYTA